MAANEAAAFHTAITNKDLNALIHAVARHDNEDLQLVAAEYSKQYGQALAEAVKSVAHGEFGTQLVNIISPRAVFAARTIHNAVEGAGTDEKAIIDVIVHITPAQLTALKEAYSNLYQQDLTARIDKETSGHFGAAVKALLTLKHTEALGNPDTEAENLYKKGEGKWGTDDDYFVHFFTSHSYEMLAAVDRAYTAKYKHSLEVAVKKETSGAYEDILVALAISRAVFWARRIRSAISGLGTDDTLLRRAFTLNSHAQLREINHVYSEVNKGKTLRSDVADDTSSEYKTLFLAILDAVEGKGTKH